MKLLVSLVVQRGLVEREDLDDLIFGVLSVYMKS